MKSQATRAKKVCELAREFRLRAAEAENGPLRDRMLCTASELEKLAATLSPEASKKPARAS